jgi:hypothetical protein
MLGKKGEMHCAVMPGVCVMPWHHLDRKQQLEKTVTLGETQSVIF